MAGPVASYQALDVGGGGAGGDQLIETPAAAGAAPAAAPELFLQQLASSHRKAMKAPLSAQVLDVSSDQVIVQSDLLHIPIPNSNMTTTTPQEEDLSPSPSPTPLPRAAASAAFQNQHTIQDNHGVSSVSSASISSDPHSTTTVPPVTTDSTAIGCDQGQDQGRPDRSRRRRRRSIKRGGGGGGGGGLASGSRLSKHDSVTELAGNPFTSIHTSRSRLSEPRASAAQDHLAAYMERKMEAERLRNARSDYSQQDRLFVAAEMEANRRRDYQARLRADMERKQASDKQAADRVRWARGIAKQMDRIGDILSNLRESIHVDSSEQYLRSARANASTRNDHSLHNENRIAPSGASRAPPAVFDGDGHRIDGSKPSLRMQSSSFTGLPTSGALQSPTSASLDWLQHEWSQWERAHPKRGDLVPSAYAYLANAASHSDQSNRGRIKGSSPPKAVQELAQASLGDAQSWEYDFRDSNSRRGRGQQSASRRKHRSKSPKVARSTSSSYVAEEYGKMQRRFLETRNSPPSRRDASNALHNVENTSLFHSLYDPVPAPMAHGNLESQHQVRQAWTDQEPDDFRYIPAHRRYASKHPRYQQANQFNCDRQAVQTDAKGKRRRPRGQPRDDDPMYGPSTAPLYSYPAVQHTESSAPHEAYCRQRPCLHGSAHMATAMVLASNEEEYDEEAGDYASAAAPGGSADDFYISKRAAQPPVEPWSRKSLVPDEPNIAVVKTPLWRHLHQQAPINGKEISGSASSPRLSRAEREIAIANAREQARQKRGHGKKTMAFSVPRRSCHLSGAGVTIKDIA